jgi:endoglucanase
MLVKGLIRVIVGTVIAVASIQAQAEYNYAEVLQKSIYFYECQQSGPLPAWNRVQWRGPSCLNDGKDVGVDLTGGWYDAGDHVKFNFPMAFSTTALAWGAIEYLDAYTKSGQLPALLNNLRFVCDYLMRCHTSDNEFWGQVGNGGLDHAFWGPAESVEFQMKRPSYKIDAAHPGTDLAGEAAAALAACAIVFKTVDAAYSAKLLGHARKLYDFADKYRGKYPTAISDAQGYYNSFSGYKDELVWGAIWLYKATQEPAYLQKAEKDYDSLATEPQMTDKQFIWTIAWDDKSFGCYVLLAQLTGKEIYHTDAQRWLDYWTVGYKTYKIKYTPGGLAWLDQWGSNRYACNAAFCAILYSDFVKDATLKKRYHDFAVSQIKYVLGDNPSKRSFVVGFGQNPPQRPHHRTCEGKYPGDASDKDTSVHILYGALVGGPGNTDAYTDDRSNYTNNEVACDYNALFTGLVARMYQEFGGQPVANFPLPEKRQAEFYVEASVNSSGDRFTEIRAMVRNKSILPARAASTLKFRYYLDISETIAAGLKASDVKINTNYVQGKIKVSELVPVEGSIYYVEVDLTGEVLYPGTQDSYRREIQFRMGLADNAAAGAWNPANDWSYKDLAKGYNQTLPPAINIPVYIDDKQVFGAEYNKPAFDPTAVSGPRSISLTNRMKNLVSLSVLKDCNQLLLQGVGNRALQVSIWSMSGREIGHYSVSALPAKIGLEAVPCGVYLARVSGSDAQSLTQKIAVQR